jgi:hypothetical protein
VRSARPPPTALFRVPVFVFPVAVLVVFVTFLGELGVSEFVSQLAGDDAAVLDGQDQVMAGATEVAADDLTIIRNGCYLHVTSRPGAGCLPHPPALNGCWCWPGRRLCSSTRASAALTG